MKDFSISVVLPTHNEEENITKIVLDCILFLRKTFSVFEIIVVNDGSNDKTKEIVEQLLSDNKSVKLVNHAVNKGYGSALRSGFENSVNDYIFFMDSDGQFDINDLKFLLNRLSWGCNEAAIGYRKKRADNYIRKLNQFLYHQYIKFFFGLEVKDIDCAFKLFPREVYNMVKPIKSDGALFSAELLLKLVKNGVHLNEVPVSHYPRKFGDSSGADIAVIFKMFKESWKYKKELKYRK